MINNIAVKTFFRPFISLNRGKNNENKAAAVKNEVCDSPTAASLVPNSFAMVTNTGLNILALS